MGVDLKYQGLQMSAACQKQRSNIALAHGSALKGQAPYH